MTAKEEGVEVGNVMVTEFCCKPDTVLRASFNYLS